MTLQYVKQLNVYLIKAKTIKDNPNINAICNLYKEIRAFLGGDYITFKLSCEYAKYNSHLCSGEEMQADLNSIVAALNGKISVIPKANEILNILSDIELIERAMTSDIDKRFQCVSQIYHSYYSVIKFDNGIINAARYADDSGVSEHEYSEATPSMLKGVQVMLERYAETLCEKNEDKLSASPLIQVTNNPTVTANATNNSIINISVGIQNAISQVHDACLPDAQEKEVLEKIQELKEIVDSKESKKNKWTKIKTFFKWVAEQGIQVASIIVPLLVNML